MSYELGKGNEISSSAQIEGNVVIGSYNYIGRNVVIKGFEGPSHGTITIGDCNFIHDNTRILMGPEGFSTGDWNVFHNTMLIMGEKRMQIGHNCWFGQNTILDSSGGLYIGNGVRVGMYSQIWTHVASGELIEGCTLFSAQQTSIEDDVWLVGSCIVSSGLTLAFRSIFLIGSVITKSTEPCKVYGGVPAELLEKLNYWKEVTVDEKVKMMCIWVKQFAEQTNEDISYVCNKSDAELIRITHNTRNEHLVFGVDVNLDTFNPTITYFDLKAKTYTKRLSYLERKFYQYIYNHKARFIPI